MSAGWRIGVDVGGTFADCVALAPDGERRRIKLLTDGRLRTRIASGGGRASFLDVPPWALPALQGMQVAQAPDGSWADIASGEEAPVLGARLLTGTRPGMPLPAMELRVGTTRGTNALLEGRLDRVALFVNEGLEGLLEIGTQARLGLFDRVPRKPPCPAQRAFGVRVRRAADGTCVLPFDESHARAQARAARGDGFEAACVAFVHGRMAPEDELRMAAILAETGFRTVTLSHRDGASESLVERAQTAAVDAALATAVGGLLARVAERAPDARLLAASSSGRVTPFADYRPKDSLLSGPAMGCAAALAAVRAAGFERAITFDMGGTSTDVARIGPEGLGMRTRSSVAGVAIAVPAVDVLSVAAGGGSVCRATREGLFVGPASAGADPGPACYGRGGPLTVTDVNLLLGRLPERGTSLPLDRAAAQAAAEREAKRAGRSVDAMLRGFLALANEHMATAVRNVSAAVGLAPQRHALAVFGGAGGQHCCAVADELGITHVLVVPHAGFVSAEGTFAAPSTGAGGAGMHGAIAAGAPERLLVGVDGACTALAADAAVDGPAVIAEPGATIVVDAGWRATPHGSGALGLSRVERREAPDLTVDVIAARCTAIASHMAAVLQRTARSVNVRERLDFSCGVLDAHGNLVANAPNVPVHLGALGACVRSVLAVRAVAPGETVLVNHPAFGGSHLPDLTVIEAVHAEDGRRIAFVAARAHHAEIGGARPGSMVPGARTLEEEGVAIPPTTVARDGALHEAAVRAILASGPWPSRDPDLNVADLRAAIAALRVGSVSLRELDGAVGPGHLHEALELLRARSAARTRAIARALPAAGVVRRELLDDGTAIAVRMTPEGDGLHVDFTGSGGTHPGNLNAPLAVVRSAVLYALRVRAGVDEPLDDHFAPLNEGFLDPVRITVPQGILDPPFDAEPGRSPAVFCGNTETSQRVTDALLAALGVAACSQGTMNNLTFGNARFSTYETLGGGSGAAPGSPGAHAVHSHMTNTRLSDPEVLERTAPLRVERLAVRTGSGGRGAADGGCGMVRRILALEACGANLSSQRRASGPCGAAGGGDGAPGTQRVIRADGTQQELPGEFSAELAAGDAVEVETPGGGAWGAAPGVSRP